jgi:hypothetical protein
VNTGNEGDIYWPVLWDYSLDRPASGCNLAVPSPGRKVFNCLDRFHVWYTVIRPDTRQAAGDEPLSPYKNSDLATPKSSRSHPTSSIAPLLLYPTRMHIASIAPLSTPASTSFLLDADDVFPSSGSSSGASWLHPTKHECEIYVGHFRCVALSAVQNMLFLLRNASASTIEVSGTQYLTDLYTEWKVASAHGAKFDRHEQLPYCT